MPKKKCWFVLTTSYKVLQCNQMSLAKSPVVMKLQLFVAESPAVTIFAVKSLVGMTCATETLVVGLTVSLAVTKSLFVVTAVVTRAPPLYH